jgi:pimeloyl-ACP methyl ester carboxylesterase
MSNPWLTRLLIAGFFAPALTLGAGSPQAAAHSVTVVLVHGAFENSSIWSDVIPRLQRHGI